MIEIEIYDLYNELLQYSFEVTGYRNKIKLVPGSSQPGRNVSYEVSEWILAKMNNSLQ